MHVNAAVLAVMDLVVANNRIAGGSYLNAGQRIAVDVVVLDQTAALAENVHAALVAIVDLILADGRIAVGRDPDAWAGAKQSFSEHFNKNYHTIEFTA